MASAKPKAPVKAALPAEVRAARAFLISKGIKPHQIPPRKFANSAKELGIGFQQLLSFISRVMSGGQDKSRWREEAIISQATKR